MHSLEVLSVMHFQIFKTLDDIFEMSKIMLCLKHQCKRKKMCVTVMLVLPVWTQVESQKLWQVTFLYNLRQWLYTTN